MPDARDVALNYLKAFENKDAAAATALLHPHGLFKGPMASYDSAEAFIKELAPFMVVTKGVRINKVFSDANDACIFWDYETTLPSVPTLPVAEWYRIEGGKIREMHVHYNPMPFLAAIEKGELAEALKSAPQK